MSSFITGFKCINCAEIFSPDYEDYICSKCSCNLDVLYSYNDIKKIFSIDVLKKNPGKNIWRYSPLFPIENLAKIPPLDMSITPLYRSSALESETGLREIYLKDDTRLPSGSFKDRAGAVVMTVAREKGVKIVSCASTGNAGCSWACMGAACKVKVVIYVPGTAPRAKLAQLKVYGADVRIVNGTYDNAYDLCVIESLENEYFNRCTGYNPYTREGKKSVSFELWEQLGYNAPGTVFVPVGDGNIISGVWKGFKDLKNLDLIDQMPQLVAVQSEKSDAVIRTIEKLKGLKNIPEKIDVEIVKAATRADSISVDKPRDGLAAVKAIIDTGMKYVRVTDKEIVENIFYMASTAGIFTEPAGVASVAGLRKFPFRNNLKGPVVCMLTGNGLKDVEAVLSNRK